jgi:hypothetical protein
VVASKHWLSDAERVEVRNIQQEDRMHHLRKRGIQTRRDSSVGQNIHFDQVQFTITGSKNQTLRLHLEVSWLIVFHYAITD